MSIGNQIMSIRRERQLTQEQFGSLFHVTRQTVSNWENGKSYPDLQLLVAISDQFGVSLDTLLKEDTKMVKAIDRERRLGVAKREKAVNHFFTSAGTGLVASCVISPASAARTAIFIAGFLMILIGWWRQSRWEEKMLSRLAENPDEKNCLRFCSILTCLRQSATMLPPILAGRRGFEKIDTIEQNKNFVQSSGG